MSKEIIGSLEEWDTILGNYRPNGSSPTWYLKELGHIRIPTMWGEWNLFTEDGVFFDERAINSEIFSPYYHEIVSFLPIGEVNNIPHLYIITICTPSFFDDNDKVGFSCMSEKYKTDVREGRCKVVLTLAHEGYSGMKHNFDFEKIDQWRIKEKFPVDSVYYICGNLIGDQIAREKNLGIKVIPIQMFEKWNWGYNQTNDDPPVQFDPVDEKCLYLAYSRQPRVHRIYFVHELIKYDLFKKGLVSLNFPWKDTQHYTFPNVNREIFEYIMNKAPFNIDPSLNLKYNLACNLVSSDYIKTFISVISETLVNDDCLFLSEKIWKPIIIGHPFMVYGGQNTLKYLKQLGYKTFDEWIDESYDSEPNHFERGNMIIKELLKFNSMSIDRLKEIREEMYPICQYNKKHFINLINFNYKGDKSVQMEKILTSIWKTISE